MKKGNFEGELAENLRLAIRKAGISTTDLAKESGVSMATLSRILSGQVNPSMGNMVKISQALNMSLDILAGSPILSSVEGGAVPESEKTGKTPQPHIAGQDILATFSLEKTDLSPKEAAKLLTNAANGSWVVSWTDQFVDAGGTPRPRALRSRQTGTRRIEVQMSFPHDMVEAGSVASLVSVVSAAVTSTGAKLVDIRLPDVLVRTFAGPAFGIGGLRDSANKFARPLLSTTLRPMRGLSPRMYGRATYEALKGGVDITCDPTLMHSIPSSGWRERFRFLSEAVHAASNTTNEYKIHAVNVSAPATEDILERAEFAKSIGLNMVMVDSAAIGWSGLESLARWCRRNDIILAGMGSRALQTNIISEHLLAKLLRFSGCDVVSIGSPLRGGVASRRMVRGVTQTLTSIDSPTFEEGGVSFDQPFHSVRPVMPACGGGHNPWHFPRLIDALGDDIIIQCGGSVMGHPWGSAAGATANRTAVEAIVQARAEGHNITVDGRSILQRLARHSNELKASLEYWQEGAFLFGVILGEGESDGLDAIVTNPEGPPPGGGKPTLVPPQQGDK